MQDGTALIVVVNIPLSLLAAVFVLDRDVDAQPAEEALTGSEVQAVGPGRHRPLEQVPDASIGVGQGLGEPDRAVRACHSAKN